MTSSAGSRWLRRSRLRRTGPSKEDMEAAPVTAATGTLGPVIAKLAALLGSEYKLRRRTRRDVKIISAKLKPVHSILWNIWEKEELDDVSMALKMEALDLADDVDDVIVDFILSMERSHSKKRLVQTKIKASPFHDFKKRASDVLGRCRSKWTSPTLWTTPSSTSSDDSRPCKPRAYPFVRKDASELAGIVGPGDRLIKELIGDDETKTAELQLKMATIYGLAGMGKTTLVDQVYEAIGNKFQARAFVSLTPGGHMREVLAKILEQVAANSSVPLAGRDAADKQEHLIDIISNFLKDKRYLVIIDDIWNLRELEIVKESLPKNNLGSRIVITSRNLDVTVRRPYDPNASWFHRMIPLWGDEKELGMTFGKENIVNLMFALKPDLVTQGFDFEHSIVNMCGGTPLAVVCMLSAVAREREKQAREGLPAKACNVQDEIFKHVEENGIQNTPGFEPLVESLQLGYDDLPHHMLKTCLLYCSIYNDGHSFYQGDLLRRWISEGFVTEEEGNCYFEELEIRGLIVRASTYYVLKMHPMMRNFLRWKSRQDNFSTCSSELTPSYNNTRRIRRLCIDGSPCRSRDAAADSPSRSSDAAADPLSALDWNHIRSLVVCEGIEKVPLEKLEGVRLLDLCELTSLLDHHLKDICGLVRLRHLLGFGGELPKEIASLQQLKTLNLRGTRIGELPKEIGDLHQLDTLDMRDLSMLKELPKEIGGLQQLRTLDINSTPVAVLPKEIGDLQQLRTLDINRTAVAVLPKEIGSLQKLKTFDISDTEITVLPKEMGRLQNLEHLIMVNTAVEKVPKEIGGLKELKSLKLDRSYAALPLEVFHALPSVELPECIRQALKMSDLLLSELAGEMLSFNMFGALIVGAKQMHIPSWIREHFNALAKLEISICILEEGGLKILREMPRLEYLTLAVEVVPREAVVIGSEGFAMLISLTVGSRVPRLTFQEGAMPKLKFLNLGFTFYAGPPNKDPVGINNLRSLGLICFYCNEDWYGGGDSPWIRPTIDVVRKEAQEHPNEITLDVPGRDDLEIFPERSSFLSSAEMEQGEEEEGSSSGTSEEEEEEGSSSGTSEETSEEEEEERSNGVSEIKETIQA